jgi:hypothetical protein
MTARQYAPGDLVTMHHGPALPVCDKTKHRAKVDYIHPETGAYFLRDLDDGQPLVASSSGVELTPLPAESALSADPQLDLVPKCPNCGDSSVGEHFRGARWLCVVK